LLPKLPRKEDIKLKEQKAKDLLSFDEAEGKVSAVFSVFNEIDSDGDVVLPKSIRSGYGDKGVVMCWGHDWKHIIGKGVIRNEENQAVFHGEFNMNTTAGKEAYETVKAMGDIQQWSFGFEVNDSERGMFTKDGQETEVRFLKDVKVWEVSPVLVGANQNTHTLAVKEKDLEDNDGIEIDTEFEEVKDVGIRFTDEVDNLLIKMTALLKRAKELTALRLGKEKTLSEDSTEALDSLKDALEEMHQDIDTLLNVASSDKVEVIKDEIDVNDLFRTTSELLADTLDL
jgi:HK97 family phage prohead protease